MASVFYDGKNIFNFLFLDKLRQRDRSIVYVLWWNPPVVLRCQVLCPRKVIRRKTWQTLHLIDLHNE